MVRILIELSDDSYNYIMGRSIDESNMLISDIIQKRDTLSAELIESVSNGTTLPNGHGRLIDADVTKNLIGNLDGVGILGRCIDEIPTVVEAHDASHGND